MSLGAALLQPQTLQRAAPDPVAALIEDVTRLVALLIEDAAAQGPVAGELEPALLTVGQTLAGSIGTRRAAAETRLRTRFADVRGFFDGLMTQTTAASGDPEKILALIRTAFDLAKSATEAATLPSIRAELTFLKALIEDDLGLSAAFLGETVVACLTEFRRRLAALPDPGDATALRRLRLARAILGRLALRASLLRPPAIEVEPLARLLHELLTDSGVTKALREVSCVLDGVEAALNASIAAGRAVAVAAQPVGAGVVPRPNAAEYSYYASWLLRDEDVPLLGLSDLDDAAGFLNQLKSGANIVERLLLNNTLTPAERTALEAFSGTGEPPKDLLLTILAAINREMQAESMLRNISDQFDTDYGLNDDIRDLSRDYAEDQSLFLLNRRVLEKAFAGKIDTFSTGFGRWLWWDLLNPALVHYPRNQVFVTGDRRFVMCDDIPMLSGEDLHWHHAPMFADSTEGAMWFKFDHASREFCEVWAQIWTIAAECAKAIWHLVKVQPGHEWQAAPVGTIEIVDTLQQILFGKPYSAHFLEGNKHLRRWGKTLDSSVGLKGLSTLGFSFTSLQSNAPTEKAAFWLTVLMGDIIRNVGPISTCNLGRDLFIEFVTLMNFRGPRDGPSTLPSNPAWNHRKQASFVSLSDTLFGMLLISLYPRDNYSIEIWSAAGIEDRRKEMMAGHWLGGSAGLGLSAGLAGSFVAQFIAWAEDFKRFFKTGGISAAKMFVLYWIYSYLFRENATDDGRYRPAGTGFRGYPDRDTAPSPYLLPFAGGTAQYTGQANLGLFSHNFISNSDFVPPINNATQQTYAYDFGHDFGTAVACSRAGVVWSFTEGNADSSTGPWNVIIIRHATIDNEHDDFGNGPVQTYGVYGHLAFNGVTSAPQFGGTAPTQESLSPGAGTAVAQGDLIALAGDTGTSFHNHLHMHILPDDGTGNPNQTFAIPFVFEDAPGDGVLKSTTWYRSGNN